MNVPYPILITVSREKDADERHHDVLDQRADDLPESRPDDDAHRQIDDIALEGKILELINQRKRLLPRVELRELVQRVHLISPLLDHHRCCSRSQVIWAVWCLQCQA